ncbi:copper transporter 1-like [Carica papaya]|uniref:copper transporter 1-like n=1 Tax=Carica papaya TaxID=3649 RepID=UPI000B8CCC5C|nr:copper transporter 1-like [Carica papaya]
MSMMKPGSMNGDEMKSVEGMSMHMSFYWGKEVTIFFSGWPDTHLGMYILALFVVFVLSFGVEILSLLPLLKTGTSPILAAFVQAIVYAIRMAFAYLVMLSVMSYNLGIFIVAVAGHAIAYFLIRYRDLAAKANQISKL